MITTTAAAPPLVRPQRPLPGGLPGRRERISGGGAEVDAFVLVDNGTLIVDRPSWPTSGGDVRATASSSRSTGRSHEVPIPEGRWWRRRAVAQRRLRRGRRRPAGASVRLDRRHAGDLRGHLRQHLDRRGPCRDSCRTGPAARPLSRTVAMLNDGYDDWYDYVRSRPYLAGDDWTTRRAARCAGARVIPSAGRRGVVGGASTRPVRGRGLARAARLFLHLTGYPSTLPGVSTCTTGHQADRAAPPERPSARRTRTCTRTGSRSPPYSPPAVWPYSLLTPSRGGRAGSTSRMPWARSPIRPTC